MTKSSHPSRTSQRFEQKVIEQCCEGIGNELSESSVERFILINGSEAEAVSQQTLIPSEDIPPACEITPIDIDRYLHMRRKKRNAKLSAFQFLGGIALVLTVAIMYSGCLRDCIRDPVPFLTLKLWIFSRDAKTIVHRGESYQRRGNLDEALADYDQALLVDPTYADARDKKVNVLIALSRFDDAWNANKQLNNASAAYLANKARIQHAQGNFLAAAKSFEEAPV